MKVEGNSLGLGGESCHRMICVSICSPKQPKLVGSLNAARASSRWRRCCHTSGRSRPRWFLHPAERENAHHAVLGVRLFAWNPSNRTMTPQWPCPQTKIKSPQPPAPAAQAEGGGGGFWGRPIWVCLFFLGGGDPWTSWCSFWFPFLTYHKRGYQLQK